MFTMLRTLFSIPSALTHILRRCSTTAMVIPRVHTEGEETAEPDELYRLIEVEVKGHDTAVLRSYDRFVNAVGKEFDLSVTTEYRNRPIIDRLSLNKSKFIYKAHQRQYEFRTHYITFKVPKITGCTASVFLEFIQRNLPEGVAMKVTKHQLSLLPQSILTSFQQTAEPSEKK